MKYKCKRWLPVGNGNLRCGRREYLDFFDGVFLVSFSGIEIVYCFLLYHKDDVDEFPFIEGL